MAVSGFSIEDSGDGTHPAPLSGDYVKDASNHKVTMNATGKGSTNFILPSGTEWFLVETYDVDGVSGDIGLTAYKDDLTNFTDDIEALRQEAIGYYTSFTMKTTHYKTGGLADVYEASESAAHTILCSGIEFTPPSTNWYITNVTVGGVCQLEAYDSSLLYDSENMYSEFDHINPVVGPDGYLYDITKTEFSVYDSGTDSYLLAHISDVFGDGWEVVDWNNFVNIHDNYAGNFKFLEDLTGLSGEDALHQIIQLKYGGAYSGNQGNYFTYNGSGGNTATLASTEPSGTLYCGDWPGQRKFYIRKAL